MLWPATSFFSGNRTKSTKAKTRLSIIHWNIEISCSKSRKSEIWKWSNTVLYKLLKLPSQVALVHMNTLNFCPGHLQSQELNFHQQQLLHNQESDQQHRAFNEHKQKKTGPRGHKIRNRVQERYIKGTIQKKNQNWWQN